jgi:uncharacterized RDD family membrane protein YckC
MPYCVKCGKNYEIGEKYCSHCGAEVYREEYKANHYEINSDSVKEQNLSKLGDLPAAKIGLRLGAGFIDVVIGTVLIFIIIRIIFFRLILNRAFIRGFISVLIIYAISALYFLLRDGLQGKSIGKLIFGLTTVNIEDNKPADISDSLLRNSILAIIVIPIVGWIAFLLISTVIAVQISLGKKQRLGDRFANTLVIEDKYFENP